jgi:hypothetical protein
LYNNLRIARLYSRSIKGKFMRRLLYTAAVTLVTALALSAAVPAQPIQAQTSTEWQIVAELDPTFAVEWIQATYDAVMAAPLNPPNSARVYAYAGLTLYEALYPGMPINRSFVGQLNGLRDLPYPDSGTMYDWQVVTATAMQQVLNKLFEGRDQAILDTFVTLRDEHIARAPPIWTKRSSMRPSNSGKYSLPVFSNGSAMTITMTPAPIPRHLSFRLVKRSCGS